MNSGYVFKMFSDLLRCSVVFTLFGGFLRCSVVCGGHFSGEPCSYKTRSISKKHESRTLFQNIIMINHLRHDKLYIIQIM